MPSEEATKKKITLTFFVEEDIGRRLQPDEWIVDSVKHKYYDHIYERGCSNCEVIVETHDPGAEKRTIGCRMNPMTEQGILAHSADMQYLHSLQQ